MAGVETVVGKRERDERRRGRADVEGEGEGGDVRACCGFSLKEVGDDNDE